MNISIWSFNIFKCFPYLSFSQYMSNTNQNCHWLYMALSIRSLRVWAFQFSSWLYKMSLKIIFWKEKKTFIKYYGWKTLYSILTSLTRKKITNDDDVLIIKRWQMCVAYQCIVQKMLCFFSLIPLEKKKEKKKRDFVSKERYRSHYRLHKSRRRFGNWYTVIKLD